MALVALTCHSCGHGYDAITGSTIRDADLTRCPACSSFQVEQSRTPQRFAYAQGYDYAGAHPLEKQMAIDNRRDIEANAAKYLSGEREMQEPKGIPAELRPQVPAHLKKTYA